jgi:hypothetical protein
LEFETLISLTEFLELVERTAGRMTVICRGFEENGGVMNTGIKLKSTLVLLLGIMVAAPLSAHGNKNKDSGRGILEKMDAVPCGAKQTGLAGLGTLWASAGITHVNTNEKLCPQYLLRTDDMDYEIRPMDLKHATILPIGKEGEFKIKKNEMILTMTNGSDQKPRNYEVVSMDPANPDSGGSTSSNPSADDR